MTSVPSVPPAQAPVGSITSIDRLHAHPWASINATRDPGPKAFSFKPRAPNQMPLSPRPDASMECLFGRLHRIHALLVHRGFSDAVASRAVEEVLEVGRQAINSGKAASMSPEQRAGWLWTLAKRAALRAAKKEVPRVSLTYDPPDYRLPAVDHHRPSAIAVRRAIARLPAQQRTAVTLCILLGLTRRQAAREMGIKVSTVCCSLRAAFTRLRKELAMLETHLIPGEIAAGR